MRLELTGRHLDITPSLRRLVDTKLARLDRLLNDSAVSAQVVLSRERQGHRADITLHARGEKFLHGVGRVGATWEISICRAVEKIVQQAQRVKGKWQERKRRGPREAAATEPKERAAAAPLAAGRVRTRMPRTFRTTRQAIRTMSVADAAREAEANGEGIIVFREGDTAILSVLYRRATGELALVQTEV